MCHVPPFEPHFEARVTDIVLYDAPLPMNFHNSLFIPDNLPTFSLTFQRPSFRSRLPLALRLASLPNSPISLLPPLNQYGRLCYGVCLIRVIPLQTAKTLRRCFSCCAKGLEVLVHHFFPRTVHPFDCHRICEFSPFLYLAPCWQSGPPEHFNSPIL